jgi:hypothetical protein
VQRTREGRDAMAGELVRRVKKAIGMARWRLIAQNTTNDATAGVHT